MSYLMQVAAPVTSRVHERMPRDGSPVRVERITAGQVALIIAAIIKGCDEYNPGWREWVVGMIRGLFSNWFASEAQKTRLRAERARHPKRVGFLNRGQARRDRAMVVGHVRKDRLDANAEGRDFDRPDDELIADAILETTATLDDYKIKGVIEEVSAQ